MQKDFKIGLIVGLGLLIVAVLWLATRSSLAPEARLRRAVSSGVDSRDSNPYLAGTTVRAGGVSSGSAGSATNAHVKRIPANSSPTGNFGKGAGTRQGTSLSADTDLRRVASAAVGAEAGGPGTATSATSKTSDATGTAHTAGTVGTAYRTHTAAAGRTGVSGQPEQYYQPKKIKTRRFYIVRKDDTLSSISNKYYGSPNKWNKIYQANRDKLPNPNKVKLGLKLYIPD